MIPTMTPMQRGNPMKGGAANDPRLMQSHMQGIRNGVMGGPAPMQPQIAPQGGMAQGQGMARRGPAPQSSSARQISTQRPLPRGGVFGK